MGYWPKLDKSEDGMGVYMLAIKESVLKDDGLEGQDMSPSGFLLDQSRVKNQVEAGERIVKELNLGEHPVRVYTPA